MFLKLSNGEGADSMVIPYVRKVRMNMLGLHLTFRDPDFGARMGFDIIDPVLRKNEAGKWQPPLRDPTVVRTFSFCEILEDE